MLFSRNITVLLNEVLKDSDLCKLIAYNDTDPLAQPNVDDPKSLMLTRLMPYPFDTRVEITDTVQLRVYYLGGDFINNHQVDRAKVCFDIVVAKSLWLINIGRSAIRPYEIMDKIVDDFKDKSIDTVGKLHFESFRHVPLSPQFDCIQLLAEVTTY